MAGKLKRKIERKKHKINLDKKTFAKRLISSSLLIAYTTFIISPAAIAQQIVPDGRTNTTLDINGKVTNVNTGRVHGVNAFNSFSKFDVYQGNTVNLMLPNSAANLINLINGNTSHIDGILNSIKNGQIGGNVYLLNPQGVIFGKSSSVNVGSLNVFTPTQQQMDRYMDMTGNINHTEVGNLLNGEVALTDTGLITADGQINVQKNITLAAGNLNISGDILSGAVFEHNKVDFSDVVNTNGYNAAAMDMVVQNGEFIIKAVNNIEISGKLVNDGADKLNGGDIDIIAGNNINVIENAIISAKGRGENSNGGEVYLWADNIATFNNNALIDTRGGNISGNGGDIEFSAIKVVNIHGGKFDASAINGEAGNVLIDPDELNINSNFYSLGNNITYEADERINVSDGVTISTVNTPKTFAGDLTMESRKIYIGDDVTLDTYAENSLSNSGDITLTVYADRNSPVYADIESKIDIGENVVLKGNNITLESTADSTHYFDEDTSEFIDTPLDYLDNFSLFAGYAEVKADSKIDIGNNAIITSVNDFTANAITRAEADISVATTGAGVSIAKVDSDANIILGDNVEINSGNNIEISAYNDSDLNSTVMAYYFGEGSGIATNITFAYGQVYADSKVDISSSSSLSAGSNINIRAETEKNIKVSASSNSYEDGNAGIAVAVSRSEVNNTVDAGGTMEAENIEITSNVLVIEKYPDYTDNDNPDNNFEAGNSVLASTDVGSGIGGKILVPLAKNSGLKNKMSSWFSNLNQSLTKAKAGGTKLALAGGVAYGEHTNNSTVNIKKNSTLKAIDTASDSGNIILDSLIKKMVEVSAKSFVNPQDNIKKENAVSVAVAVSEFNNNSETKVGNGSTLDASQDIEVKSTVKMPYHITWHEIHGISDITEKLNGDLGIQNGMFTTWARSTVGTSDGAGSAGNGIGIGGSVNIADFNSTSKAIIGNNVEINQNIATEVQKVIVQALSDTQTVNFSGIVGLTFFGAKAGSGGVGGSYIDIGYDNDVQAIINSGSVIDSNYLQVDADSTVNNLSIATSSSKAGKFAFSGSFAFMDIDNTTLAHIDSGSTINIGSIGAFSDDDDIENGLEVTATDNSKTMNVTGGVTKAENVGIGVSLTVSEINRDTQAVVGKNIEDEITKTNLNLTTNSDILVQAENTGLISTWGLAGAIATNEPGGQGAQDASSKGGESGSGQFGLAVSGDVGISTLDETIKAYINNTTLDTQSHDIDITATSDNNIEAFSGAASLSVSQGKGESVGIAGSYSGNEINSDVEAFILDSDINNSTSGGDITLISDYTGSIWGISAGASGSLAMTGIAVAGSVAINDLDIDNSAYIKDSTITDINDISLTATNDADIEAYGGVLAAGFTAGVGAALALNDIGEIDDKNNNLAYIESATIDNTGDITLTSTSDNKIETLSGSIGIGKTAGIAASVSLNEINNNTSAYVKDSDLISSGSLTLSASDTSSIEALIASAAISGAVAAGVSVVTNDINNAVKAYIDSSKIETIDEISLSSLSDNIIKVLSLAFSASGKLSLSGSNASNEIYNETKSYIKDSNGLNKIKSNSDDITLHTEDTSEIKSIAGMAAISGTVGAGESYADNTISNETYSYVENSSLEAGNQIKLSSLENELIESISAAGAGGGTGSAAASVSANDIDNKVKAYILNSTAVSNGLLDLSATNYSTIKSINTTLSGGGYAGIGGGRVDNDIQNDILAFIKGSTVDSGSIKIASKADSTIKTAAIGVAGSGGAAASGSEAENLIRNDIKAYIENCSDVDSSGDITISAEDTSSISAIAGNAAFGGVGIGISIADNDIQNDIEAYILNSTVDADGKIDMDAKSTQEIEVWAVAGAASTGFSGAASTSDIDIENNVKAYVDDSDIKGNDGIYINSLNTTENIDAKTGGVGVSLSAAFGGAKSTIDINNSTLAYIEDSTADACANKNIEIISESVESTDNKVLAGAASLYASAQASYSETNSRTSTKAYLGNNVTVNEANDIVIKADRDVDLYSEALGGAAGAVAVGGSIARTNIMGATNAYVGYSTTVGQSGSKAGSIDIDANSKTIGESKTRAGAAGIASGNGSDARTNIETGINAYINNNATIYLTDDINIDVITQVKSIANALGGAFGGVAVGVSIAQAKATPTIATYIGENAYIEADDIILAVNHNDGITDMAKATAKSTAGALIGGTGSTTLADVNSTIDAYIDENAQIYASGDLSLGINSYIDAKSDATGRAYGAIAGGYTEAKSDITENNNVFIANNTSSGKSINADNIKMTLKANKKADTSADAGSGGLASGIGSLSELDVTANNKIYTGNSSSSSQNNINTDGDFIMDADSTLSYRSTNDNSSTGVIAVGVPKINNDINLNTELNIGNYNNVTTGGDLTLDGYNKISDFGSGYILEGGASGLAGVGSGDSRTNADSTVKAKIGNNAVLDIGDDLNMLLTADSDISESGKLVAKGGIPVADLDLRIDIDNDLTATFGSNSTIDTYNNINTYLKSRALAEAYVLSECKGLAPVADGYAKADVYSRNLIDIQNNATIRPNKDAYFVIGRDIRGGSAYHKAKATAKGDSAGLLWNFGSVGANANINIDNDINIASASNLTAGEDVNLISNSGSTYADGYSRSKSKFYLLFGIPITRYKHGGSDSISTSNNVKVNGYVQSGLYNNRKLTIALDGTVTEEGVYLDGEEEYEYNRTASLQEEIDVITDDIAELNADLTDAKADQSAAQDVLDSKESEKQTLETEKTNKIEIKDDKTVTKNNKIDLKNDKMATKSTKETEQNNLDKDDENYQNDYDALQAEIDQLDTEITTLDAEIASLNGEITTLDGEITEIDADIITKNNEIDEAQTDLDNKTETVNNIETDIDSKETSESDLQALLDDTDETNTITALKVKPTTIDSGYVKIEGNLSGNGTIKAPGNDFSIEVTNRTAKNMVFDVLKINQNANGDIRLNGSKLTNNYGGITIDPGKNEGKIIYINNAFDPDDPSILLEQADSSDLLFSKDIENLGGDFIVKNMSGSVFTQGLINAKNVFIYVPKGDYVHEFTKGRYLTGGVGSEPSILYAGENIIISAQKIDLNGTVQSGTDYRSVIINDFNPDTDLTYNDVTEKTELIPVTTDGDNQDINGIKAVWDPDTQKIKLYRADIRGGNVLLQGEILSSGNGKLRVVSGYGEIEITNNTDYDIEINQLNTNQEVNGKVKINNFKVSDADANKIVNKEITFSDYMESKNLDENEISISRDDNRVIQVKDYDGNNITSPNVNIVDSNNAVYTPNSDAGYKKNVSGTNWKRVYVARSWWTEFWHGKKYVWVPVNYTKTVTVAAKQPIGIEFLGKDQGKITINNNGVSDIYLKENVMNNSGDVIISNANGSIYNMGSSTIQSKNINLAAKNNIGSADKAILTDLRDGHLTALSSNAGLVNIEETVGQMLVDKAMTTGDLILTADGAIRATSYAAPLIKGHDVSLTSYNDSVGTYSQDMLVSTTGELSVEAQKDIYITEAGDIKAHHIKAEDGDVKLTTTSLERASSRDAGLANISANNVTINVDNNVGNMLSDDNAVFIDATGNLNVQAGSDIHLNTLSDININKVYSDTGDVKLISAGNINANNLLVSFDDPEVNIANIRANNLDIISTEGGISNVNLDLSGIINAQAKQGIILSNTNHVIPDAAKNDINLARTYVDDLRIGTIYSESGDVVITSEREILDAKADESLNINGVNVTLTSNLGNLGTIVDDLNIKSSGVLTASAYEKIYITSPDSLNLLTLESSAKNNETPKMLETVVLNTTNNITDKSEYEDYNIESKNIVLNALQIGSEENYLDVNSDTVNATAPSGIYISETDDDLNITANSTAGNIMTNADDGKIIASVAAGGFLRASADDDINITETSGDMSVDTIESDNGDVTLTASAGSITDYNATENNIKASGDLNLNAINGNIDTDINVEGVVTSSSNENTDIEAVSGDINVKNIASVLGDVDLKADGSILDANSLNTTTVAGKDLTLTAVNGSIGALAKYLRTLSTNKINLSANTGIYVTETAGDLVSDTIISNNGSIGLSTDNGNIIINYISTPELIEIIANGDLIDIETIDPKEIILYTSNEGGTIDVNKAFVSDDVKLKGDNIIGNFTDTSIKDPLAFSITGNDGNTANSVILNVAAGNFGINKFTANTANIISGTNVLNWNQVKIGSELNLKTPGRTILLKNVKGFLDQSKDVQLYETGWFNLISTAKDLKTNAFVINAGANQFVNSDIVMVSDTLLKENGDNIFKTHKNIDEALNPADMRDQILNKRNSIRYNINMNGSVNIAETEGIKIKVLDISSGGAGILIDKDVPLGEEIVLKITFNGLEVDAKTKVVRKQFDERTGSYKLGLEFIDIPPEIAAKIPYVCMTQESL